MIAFTRAILKEEVRYGMQAKEMLNVYATLLKGSPTDSYHITDSYRPLIQLIFRSWNRIGRAGTKQNMYVHSLPCNIF